MKRYGLIFIVFLLIDIIWLAKIAPSFYKSHLGHLMADKVSYIPALVFYLSYIVALLVFVVNPAVESQSILKALYLGALIGFVMYGTYDLTNMATLRDWPLVVTIADLVWGTFITSITSVISTFLIMKFNW